MDHLNGQFHFRGDSLSLSISPVPEGQSEILHLSGRTIADVSRGRSFEEQEKCPLEMWEAVEEEMGRRERGFSRKGDKAGKKEREREVESRPISVWPPELGDGLGKSAEVAGLSLPIAVRRGEGSKDK